MNKLTCKNKVYLFSGSLAMGMVIGGVFIYSLLPKVPLKQYTKTCLYIAVMDDEIARLRFEDKQTTNGEIVAFPPRRESLMYRYRLHLNMHKRLSAKELESEVKLYEAMLMEEK